jgi:hypothetical protein
VIQSRLDAEITRAFELSFHGEPARAAFAAARRVARERGLAACCGALLATRKLGEIE